MASYVAIKGCSVSKPKTIKRKNGKVTEDVTIAVQVVLKRGEPVPNEAPALKVQKLVQYGMVVDADTDEGKAAVKRARDEEAREAARLAGLGDPSTDRTKTAASEGRAKAPAAS